MKTFIPDTKRYKRNWWQIKGGVPLHALSRQPPAGKGSNLEELITEITYYIKLQ